MSNVAPIPAETNRVASQVVDAAFRVHSTLGPGLLEAVYAACLVHELAKRGLKVGRHVTVPIVYDGTRLETGLALDMLVEDGVVVELKAVAELLPVHEAQLVTYLKISRKRLGLLVNFNVPRIKDGIGRMAL
jgi:GxxExxY protein